MKIKKYIKMKCNESKVNWINFYDYFGNGR